MTRHDRIASSSADHSLQARVRTYWRGIGMLVGLAINVLILVAGWLLSHVAVATDIVVKMLTSKTSTVANTELSSS